MANSFNERERSGQGLGVSSHKNQTPKDTTMTNITHETMTLNGVEYVRADAITTPAGPAPEYRIVVADRGWVFVGACTEDDAGNITISSAQVIRRWGTDASKPGLGYLAAHGPITGKTQLEPSGVVRVPASSLVASFDSSASVWK